MPEIVKMIHARTHVHPDTCKLHLQRSGGRYKSMITEVDEIMGGCLPCFKKRRPIPLSEIHVQPNPSEI